MWDHLRGNTLTDIGRMEAEAEKRRQEETAKEAEEEPCGQATLDRYA